MSQSLPRFRRHEEREADIARVVRIIEGGSHVARAKSASVRGVRLERHRSAEGDPLRMRGWPIIARGVPGCIPGSNPLAEACRD